MNHLLDFRYFVAMLALVMVVLLNLSPTNPVIAAPPAAPTPASNVVSGLGDGNPITFLATSAFSTTRNTTKQALGNATVMDIQSTIVQNTPVNTFTALIQFSNDGVNWVNGPTLLSSNVASTSDMHQINVMGIFQRVSMTLSGTSTVTATFIAKVR